MGKLQEHHVENVGERETHRVDPEHHERFRDPERLERLKPGELVEAFGLERDQTVIDLGCGDGLFFKYLSEAVGSDGEVIGVDVDSDMVERARETIEEDGLSNVRALVSTDDSIDLRDDSVDAAILVNSLHELASPGTTLSELHRIMKPNGRVLVHDRHKEETGEEGPPIHHLVSRDEALDYFAEAGFEHVDDIDWDPDMYTVVFSI